MKVDIIKGDDITKQIKQLLRQDTNFQEQSDWWKTCAMRTLLYAELERRESAKPLTPDLSKKRERNSGA